MRDRDIRYALRFDLDREHRGDSQTIIVEELGIDQGSARVDVAVVNGLLAGFEIKSERDTLTRLPAQVSAYSAVFDAMTLVVGANHLERAIEAIPAWWQVLVPERRGSDVALVELRGGAANPRIDPEMLAQLLWRDEALAELELRELTGGLRSKPRRELWKALARELELDELRRVVRDRLRARTSWRAAALRA
jgi:hypothetical protein